NSTDLLEPHHTLTTSALIHFSLEGWVKDYYDQEQLNDMSLVRDAMDIFSALAAQQQDIRPILTQWGAFSYAQGGIILYYEDNYDRVNSGRL
ncbi:phospholipase, partial [Pseudoalteromonas ruthenica]